MFIFPAREISQGGHIGESAELARDSRQRRQREVLDDPAVLLKLRKHFATYLVPKTERFRTSSSAQTILLHGWTQEGFNHHEKHRSSLGFARSSGLDRTPGY